MVNVMVVSLNIGSRPNNQEGITKKVLTSGGSDTKGSLHPKFERYIEYKRGVTRLVHTGLQLHSLEGVLLQDMVSHVIVQSRFVSGGGAGAFARFRL